MKILIVGPQGSGKTTQSELLANYLRVSFIETGKIFRNLSREDSDLGRKIKDLLDRGEMISDDVTSKIVKERVRQSDCQSGFVMNGYPRSLNQIKIFDPVFDKVIYLEVSDDEIMRRLIKRGREDDTPDLINKRLSDYHNLTEPILDYYNNLGILEKVDGIGEVDGVQERVRSKVDG